MANPHIRPHLHFYPEDTDKTVNEYWHAKHWNKVTDPSLVTPMVVVNNIHFFVDEAAVLADSCVVIPYRWFLYDGSFTACVWPLHAVKHGNDRDWIVEEFKMVIIFQGKLSILLGSREASQQYHAFPNPKCIFGTFMPVMPFTLT